MAEKRLEVGKVGLGQLIKDCAVDVNAWQRGGNTILGTVMLFVPIAVAAGMTPTKEDYILDFSLLRKNIDLAVKSTTAWDSPAATRRLRAGRRSEPRRRNRH